MHLRLVVAVASFLCVVANAAAGPLPRIVLEADATGPLIGLPADYVARFGPSTKLDSVLTTFARLTQYTPTLTRLQMSGDLEIIIALDDLWEPQEPVYTNIEPMAPRCPRIFLLASFLIDEQRSDCLRAALLEHESQHALDFATGRMPAVMQTMGLTSPADAIDMLDAETRGFLAQIRRMRDSGCATEDAFARAYFRGGLPALRALIVSVYGLDRVSGTNHRQLSLYCRWAPAPTDIALVP